MFHSPTQDFIENYGKKLFSGKRENAVSLAGWSRKLLDMMMEDEGFRVAALRFVDVAPRLKNDADFMTHLAAYFRDTGFLRHFIGESIPGSGFLGKVIAPLVRRNIKGLGSSFILGETPAKAMIELEKLHRKGVFFSMDILGEAVMTKSEAERFVQAYLDAIEQIAKTAPHWAPNSQPEQDKIGDVARGNLSVKLSALYEHFKPVAHETTKEKLAERYRTILRAAMREQIHVHLDMEYATHVPLTLDVFETVTMEEEFRKYPHVGIVLQAYLKESDALFKRIAAFARKRRTPFAVRLVKGANWDFEQAYADQMDWGVPVFSTKEATDAQFEKLTANLLDLYPLVRPCIGSHNARSIAFALAQMDSMGLKKEDVEFQMLTGMAEPFRNALVDMGCRVRLYAPVGDYIIGMSYLVRRLLENTANQSFLRQYGSDNVDFTKLMAAPQVVQDAPAHLRTDDFVNHPLRDFSNTDARREAEDALEGFTYHLPISVVPMVDGRPVSKGEQREHVCPWQLATVVSRVTLGEVKDADAAVEKAKSAFGAWRNLGKAARAEILDKAAQLAAKRWRELFALQVYEAGKDWASADADIAEGIDFMRYYAREIRGIDKKFQPFSRWGEANTMRYEPRGVAVVIAPWNFPFAISAGMVSAALAAGNTVIYKPAEQTSAIGQKLCEALWDAGVPKDVLHFLPSRGELVGAHLVEHKDVALIAFTGSREVGCKIYAAAAKVQADQPQLKKCIIEMGGKNALIVDTDADLDEAVPAAVHSAFGFQGQKCSACSRVIVVGSAYEDFVERLKEMVAGLRVGAADDPQYDVNAVIDAAAKQKIEMYVQQGQRDGVLLARARLDEAADGHYVAPVVFTDLPPESKVIMQEIFGPVLAVERAKTLEEAVKMAQMSDYALTGGLFSRNPDTIEKVKATYRVGNLYINRGITGAIVGRQPFGGGHMSGTGTKAGGSDYLLHFLEPRVVTENTMRRGFAPKT